MPFLHKVSAGARRVVTELVLAPLNRAAGRRVAASVACAAILAALPFLQSPPHAQIQAVPAAAGGWLDRFNLWRTTAGLPVLSENTVWSDGDYKHSLYMVKNDEVAHQEVPGHPYYTVAGDTAARKGNIQVNTSLTFTDEQAIDWWMKAPFHALGMMDPRLTSTGFGAYRENKSGWRAGFTLDVLRGNSFTGGTYPVYWPGNGVTQPLTSYTGGEYPNPLQACPGYAAPTGLPVFVQVGGNVQTTAGPVHTFTANGAPLEHCVIDSTNPAVGSSLKSRGAVIVIPRQPLQTGVQYTVALTVNGTPRTWSFSVGPFTVAPLGWTSLGGLVTSNADASSWGATRADVFVRGPNNNLFHSGWSGTTWSPWSSLGGSLTSSPSAVSWAANRIDAFVRGPGNKLYHKAWTGSAWTAWESLGGNLTSSPAVASWGAGRLDVFVRGTDNAIWHKSWNGSRWSGWDSLGGAVTSDPAAVSSASNRIEVVVRGTDNSIFIKSWNGTAWGGWTRLGGYATSSPEVASCSGHLDVFVRGNDDGIWQTSFSGTSWSTWSSVGGFWTSAPAAVCLRGTTTIDLFARAADSALWSKPVVGT